MGGDFQGEVLRALGAFLVSKQSLGDTLTAVTKLSQQVASEARFAGLLLADERGHPATRIFTDTEALEIDQAQYDSDRGPCLDAWRQGKFVSVPDHRAAPAKQRYPEFAKACDAHGIRATVSLPILSQGSTIGALNLYTPTPGGFTTDDERALRRFAEAAEVVVANSQAYWGAMELTEQLNEAIKSRAVIEQAKGILMSRDRAIDSEDAFEMLRQASQRENVKVRDIAQRIVERRPPPPAPDTQGTA